MAEFSAVGQMESEILRMTLDLYNGPQDSCGLMTSGGTESLFIAMLTYREWGRKRGIKKPNIVCSQTAHVGMDKAAFYLGMEMRKVPLLEGQRCDVDGMV